MRLFRNRKTMSVMLAAALSVSMFQAAVLAEEPETEEYIESSEEEEEEASTEAADEGFDYSEPFDENGYFKGITALDYVTLGKYIGIKVVRDDITASEEDIMAQVQSLVDNFTTSEQVTDTSRRVVDGDTLSIDFEGKMDGVAFDGGTAQGQEVTIGVTNFIEGFLDQLIGHTPGETFDIDVTFPDPYYNNPDFSGKPAVFTITINYILEDIVPDIDDDLISMGTYGQYETLEDYKAYLKETIEKDNMENVVLEQLFNEESEVSEVPQSVIDTLYNQQYAQLEDQATFYGMTVEDLLYYYGMTIDDLKAELYEEAEEYGQRFLVVQAIREDAGLEITTEKVMEMLDADESLYEMYVDMYGEPYIFFSESSELVLNYLVENAEIVDAEDVEEEEESETAEVSEEEPEEVSGPAEEEETESAAE